MLRGERDAALAEVEASLKREESLRGEMGAASMDLQDSRQHVDAAEEDESKGKEEKEEEEVEFRPDLRASQVSIQCDARGASPRAVPSLDDMSLAMEELDVAKKQMMLVIKENVEANRRAAEANQRSEEAERMLVDLTSQLGVAREQAMAALSERDAAVRRAGQEETMRLSSIEQGKAHAESLLADAEIHKERLIKEIEDGANRETKLRSERDAILGEIDAVRGERDAILGEIDAVRGERDAILGEIDAVRGERDAALASVSQEGIRREALLSSIAALEAEKGAMSSKLAEAVANMESFEARAITLGNDKESLEAKVITLEKEYSEACVRAQRLGGDVEAAGERWRREKVVMEEILRQRDETFKAENESIKAERDSVKVENEALKGQKKVLEGEVGELEGRVADARGDAEAALAALDRRMGAWEKATSLCASAFGQGGVRKERIAFAGWLSVTRAEGGLSAAGEAARGKCGSRILRWAIGGWRREVIVKQKAIADSLRYEVMRLEKLLGIAEADLKMANEGLVQREELLEGEGAALAVAREEITSSLNRLASAEAELRSRVVELGELGQTVEQQRARLGELGQVEASLKGDGYSLIFIRTNLREIT
jgi:chromosome segregation ATPase